MKKFLKITLIIIGAISLIFVALIGIGLFVDVEYDDHIENGRYTYVPEEENKDNEYVEFTINDYDKNNAKLVYYDTIEEAIQLSTLNAENEELSVPADFLNHVDETLHIWQGKKYDTIFYRAGNDNDDIQGLVMARCKKQIQNGHTQYAFINATPVTTKRDRILLDDITELIHSSLKLSDFQQDLNPDYPSKRFVYGYAHEVLGEHILDICIHLFYCIYISSHFLPLINLQALPVLHLQMMHRLHCCISSQD